MAGIDALHAEMGGLLRASERAYAAAEKTPALYAPAPDAAARPFEVNGFTVNPGDKLITYVARDLEPYRGFHTVMRALPALLQARPDLEEIGLAMRVDQELHGADAGQSGLLGDTRRRVRR